jgi:uncharacterized protein (PEP-CTERM system associated)
VPAVRLLETYTDNSSFGVGSKRTPDVQSLLTPSIVVAGRTADLTVDGTYSADLVDYARNTQPNLVAPAGHLDAQYAFVPQQIFLAGSAVSTRVLTSPFGSDPGVAPGLGNSSLTQVRLSPYLQSEPGQTLRYLVRSDNAWVHEQSDSTTTPDAYVSRQKFELERLPVPLGLAIDAEREATHFLASEQQQMTDEFTHGILRYALDSDLILGLRGGYAHNDFAAVSSNRTSVIYGGELAWKPSTTTQLSGYGEKRDFGSAWQASLSSRGSSLAFDLSSSRSVTSSPLSYSEQSGPGNFATLLDAVYAVRYQNQVDRLRAVQDLLADAQVPESIGSPIGVYLSGPIRLTLHQATLTLLRPRNVVAVSSYLARSEALPAAAGFFSAPTAALSYDATGASVSDTYRLSRLTSVTARADWVLTRGLGAQTGEETKQYTGQAQLSRRLSREVDGLVGARFRSLSSSVFGSEHELAVFAGASYRFR